MLYEHERQSLLAVYLVVWLPTYLVSLLYQQGLWCDYEVHIGSYHIQLLSTSVGYGAARCGYAPEELDVSGEPGSVKPRAVKPSSVKLG